MAVFDERIASVKEKLYYEEEPVPVSGCISPSYSYSDVEHSTTSTAWQFSSDLTPAVYIPGADLETGKKYLVFYSVAFGGETASAVGAFYLVCNLGGSDLSRGEGEGLANAAAVPKSMRCTSGQGFFVHDGDDTDLEFAYKSVEGEEIFFKGMTLIAFPLDDDTYPLTEDYDYFYEQVNNIGDPQEITQAEGWTDVVTSGSITPGVSGNYIVMASGEMTINKSDVGGMRCYIDVTGQIPDPSGVLKEEMNRYSPDSRNTHAFTHMSQISMTPSATINIKLQAAAITSDPLQVQTGRVILIREGFFDQVLHQLSLAGTPTPVIVNYPNWNYLSKAYTPNQEESVLILANACARNTEEKSFLMRLYSSSLNESFCDYVAEANHGTTARWKMISAFAVDTVNTRTFYGPAFSSEPGATLGNTEIMDADYFIISLKPAGSTPPGQAVEITDTLESTESVTGDIPAFSDIQESLGVNESLVTAIGTTAPGSIPTSRPRLWFYNNDRLSYLQTRMAIPSAEWTAFDNTVAAGSSGEAETGGWFYGLKYLVDPTDTDSRDYAMEYLSDMVNLNGSWTTEVIFGSKGLYTRYFLRTAAIMYDWFYDYLDVYEPGLKQKVEDFLLAVVYVSLNNYNNSIADNIYHTGDWATNNPYQNYFGQFQLGALYAALTLYHDQPATWGWPPGSSTRYQFWLPYDTRAYAAGTDTRTFTDLWEFVHTRYEEMAFPVWDVELDGGGWVEGSNYGRAMCRHISEALNLLNATAGVDWIKTKAWPAEIIKHELYTDMPERVVMAQYGEYGAGNILTIMAYNRAMMLQLIDGLRSTAEGRYGQYWLENEVTASTGVTAMILWDFFLYDARTAAIDYTAVLPPYHYAPGAGYVYSLSAWGADGVEVMFNAADQRANHKDRDNCNIHIYKGTISGIASAYQWPLCDPGPYTGSSAVRGSDFHNTYVIGGQGQRSRTDEGQTDPDSGSIERHFSNSVYSYAQGDMQDGYWIPYEATTSHGDTKMTDELTREFFHLRAANFVVAFDRISIEDSYSAETTIDCHWQFPYDSPIAQGGNIYLHDLGDHRIFYKIFRISPSTWPVPFVNTLEDMTVAEPTAAPDTWRHTIRLNPAFGGLTYDRDHIFMTVFELTGTSQATMKSATALSTITALLGGTISNCDGVLISDAAGSTTYVVVFSTAMDAASPTSLSYAASTLTTNTHYVCNLDPSSRYAVTNSGGQITVTEDATGGYVPNAGGVISFDPGNLSGAVDHAVTITDGISGTDSNTAAPTSHVADLTDNLEATENLNCGDIALNKDGTTLAETILFQHGIKPADSVGVSDSVTVLTETTQIDYVEKSINDILSDLVPNEDKAVSFWSPSPNDAVLYDKINNGTTSPDDASFIRAEGYGAQYAVYYAGLTSPGVYISRISSLTMKARFKEVVVGSTLGLSLSVSLMNAALTRRYVTFAVPLVDIVAPTTITTDTEDIEIGGDDAETMVAVVSLSARSWASSKIELSELAFTPTGEVAEKVI